LQEDIGLPADRIIVVKLAIDHESAARIKQLRTTEPKVDRVIFVGRDAPHKNLDRLVRGFAPTEFAAQGAVLTLAGVDGSAVQRLRALAAQVGARVELPGVIAQGALEALLASSTLLVQPSLEEGFGLPVAEAMAAGIPVAVSTGGALPEIVRGARSSSSIRTTSVRSPTRSTGSRSLRSRRRSSTGRSRATTRHRFWPRWIAPSTSGEIAVNGEPAIDERTFVFNIVITPGTIRYLQLFTRSLLAHSAIRVRLVANGCPRAELDVMDALAATANTRVDVVQLPSPAMVPHGQALDEIYAAHDDGEYFCFVDSDVKAKRSFMPPFIAALTSADVVTSCNVAWSDDAVLPLDAPDLVGRHSIGHDGFVYGSSYFAIYRRAVAERVRTGWGVTFRAYAHDNLAGPVQNRLDEIGRNFRLYDTAKVLNLLLQADGGVVTHLENPALMHVGGISQYLSDPGVLGQPPAPEGSTNEGSTNEGNAVPWFAASGTGRRRWDFAEWAAAEFAQHRRRRTGPGTAGRPGAAIARDRAGARVA